MNRMIAILLLSLPSTPAFAQEAPYSPEALREMLTRHHLLLLLALSALALLCALILLIKNRRAAGARQADMNGVLTDLREERLKLDEAQAELDSQTNELRQLRTALEEAKTRLARAEEESGTRGRSEQVNAELVQLLSLFQEKGRLIDFLMEDITGYSDAQVGTAARVMHQGCRTVLKEFFSIEPVHADNEGSTVTLGPDFSPRSYRLVGKVKGEPPYTGVVLHRGWRTKEVSLPRVVQAGESRQFEGIIAPTEVEVR